MVETKTAAATIRCVSKGTQKRTHSHDAEAPSKKKVKQQKITIVFEDSRVAKLDLPAKIFEKSKRFIKKLAFHAYYIYIHHDKYIVSIE